MMVCASVAKGLILSIMMHSTPFFARNPLLFQEESGGNRFDFDWAETLDEGDSACNGLPHVLRFNSCECLPARFFARRISHIRN
jgi:hypothetical protein